MFTLTTALLALLSVTCGIHGLKLKPCHTDKSLVEILILDIEPDPIELPGDFHVGGTVEVLQDLTSTYSVDLTLTRETLWFFHPEIPCEGTPISGVGVGTCHYPNVCDVLDKIITYVDANGSPLQNDTQCPDYFSKISPPPPCHCPIPKGTYKLAPGDFSVKKLNFFLSLLSSGTYNLKVVAKDTATKETILCYDAEIEIGDAQHHNQTAILEQTPVHGNGHPIVG